MPQGIASKENSHLPVTPMHAGAATGATTLSSAFCLNMISGRSQSTTLIARLLRHFPADIVWMHTDLVKPVQVTVQEMVWNRLSQFEKEGSLVVDFCLQVRASRPGASLVAVPLKMWAIRGMKSCTQQAYNFAAGEDERGRNVMETSKPCTSNMGCNFDHLRKSRNCFLHVELGPIMARCILHRTLRRQL